MKLSSPTRRVLTNLYLGRPMWDGVQTISPGAGVPSIVTSLLKRGLMRQDLVRGGFVLTPNGVELARKEIDR